MMKPSPGWVVAVALAACVLAAAMAGAQSPSAPGDPHPGQQSGRPDVLNLARTSWWCTTTARLDDPPRQGYMYFHPNGYVKMAQVVPASNRERANNVLWWRTREEYDFEDPTGRMWTDLDGLHDGVWASRRDHARIVYGSPPGLIILSVPRNGTMHGRFAEPDARSRTSVDRKETDPFALGVRPPYSRSTMTCELRPGWLQ